MVSLKLTYLFGRSRFESLWIAHWSLMSFCSLHTIPFWDWKWTYNWSFYHPDPIEGEDGGILLFCYSMISVCGLTFYILMVSCEDRSPSLLPPSGITLIEHPSVSISIWQFFEGGAKDEFVFLIPTGDWNHRHLELGCSLTQPDNLCLQC